MPEFNFSDNLEVESLDHVPSEYQSLYEQSENGYKIADGVKPIVDAYSGVNKALAEARQAKKAANDEAAQRRHALKNFETLASEFGIEPGENEGVDAALKRYLADLQEKVSSGQDTKVNLEKIKGEYERRLQEATTEKDKEIETLRSDIHRTKISDVAARALSEAKGSVELLMPHIESRCKVVKEDGRYEVRVTDEQGDFRSDGKGGWMNVSDLVAEMRQSKQFARAFDSETPSGGGARPSNPAAGASVRRQDRTNMSAVDKIASGLTKGQFGKN